MKSDKIESAFSVDNLILLESHFSRIQNVHFDEDVQTSVNVNADVSVQDKHITVILTAAIKQKYHEEEQLSCHVSMAGLFAAKGDNETDKDLEKFGKVNGAAIIFPYIREHISNLSLKAGLPPLILPLLNFAKNE